MARDLMINIEISTDGNKCAVVGTFFVFFIINLTVSAVSYVAIIIDVAVGFTTNVII